jgi:hypothetical protein
MPVRTTAFGAERIWLNDRLPRIEFVESVSVVSENSLSNLICSSLGSVRLLQALISNDAIIKLKTSKHRPVRDFSFAKEVFIGVMVKTNCNIIFE